MRDLADDNPVVAFGTWGRVEYAKRLDGTRPALDYLRTLAEPDRAKVRALCQLLAAQGSILNRTKFKQIENGLFEIKAFQIRMSCRRHGQCWYLLDGFTKKQDKWKHGELKHAMNLLAEHDRVLERRRPR